MEQIRKRPVDPAKLPKLSIIAAGKDEEDQVGESLKSLLALDYPDYEIIFVNDRSTDRTGEIATSLAERNPRLRVAHVDRLPEGWFGKNHALHRGAQMAAGELLLFTDADAVFAPDALKASAAHFQKNRLEFMSMLVGVDLPQMRLQVTTGFSMLFEAALNRPLWKMSDPDSDTAWGIGPFIMLNKKTYHRIGGHKSIALCPDEDIMFGRLAKKHRLRLDFLSGETCVKYRWYSTIGQMIRGREKNAFAMMNFSWPKVVFTTCLWLCMISPWILVFSSKIPAALSLASLVTCTLTYVFLFALMRFNPLNALFIPLGIILSLHILWRSAILNRRKGVRWGGVCVPIKTILANRI